MLEETKRIPFIISSVLSKVESELHRLRPKSTGSDRIQLRNTGHQYQNRNILRKDFYIVLCYDLYKTHTDKKTQWR